MSADYQPSSEGFRAMANGPEVRAALTAVADKGKAFAEALAQEFRQSGEYAASFNVSETTVMWRRGPRAAVRLENTSAHAAAVEFGNSHSPNAHRTLGRTADALKGL